MRINIDYRKLLVYSYIYKVEDFFGKYNKRYYGAVLNNFYGYDNIPYTEKYNIDQELKFNKNILDNMTYENNPYSIPYVKFNLISSRTINKDSTSDHDYFRIITLLSNDIKKSTVDQLFSAHIKFTEYKQNFLKSNKLKEKNFSCLQPNNKENVAYAYIKRLEELFGVDKYNIELSETNYNKIFKNKSPSLYGLMFERDLISKNKHLYYCKIDYNKIINSNLEELVNAHKKLDNLIQNNDNIEEDYTDERRYRYTGIWRKKTKG